MRMIRVPSLVFFFFIRIRIRIRFPRNKSIIATVRERYGDTAVQKIRRFESTDFKHKKAKLDLRYLEECQEHNVIPKFLRFRVANRNLRNSKAYNQCITRLLQEEIANKKTSIKKCGTDWINREDDLKRLLVKTDFIYIQTLFTISNDKRITECLDIHQRKLEWLLHEKAAGLHDAEKVVFNYSSHELTAIEKKVLSYGLNFSLPPKKLNYSNFMLNFEMLYREVRNKSMSGNTEVEFKTGLKNLALSSYHDYNSRKVKQLPNEELTALKNLSGNNDIVIQKSDKGNSVVVLNKVDYVNSLHTILGDKDKFSEVKIPEGKDILNTILSQEKTLVDLLKTLKIDYKRQHKQPGGINKQVYSKLYPQGSKPGRLYGSAKVHKPLENGVPKSRPIISAIGTSSYNIAKFLVPILKPYSSNEYTLTDSFQFRNEILQQEGTLHMYSMDVESLFTNLPLQETIDICVQLVYKNVELVQGLNRVEFRKLLEIATRDSIFIFDGKYYRQVDGVAMGSPLGPILANIFLSHNETKWLSECPEDCAPSYYRRYVDDLFLLFDNKEKCSKFEAYINAQHANMNFKPEYEKDNSLSFLDILVTRTDGSFTTNIYRKPTFSGVYSNFSSFMPKCYKKSLVLTLVYRLYNIVSCPSKLKDELKKLKEILFRNGYPLFFTENCIKTFFKNIRNNPNNADNANTDNKEEVTIILPYLGVISSQIRVKLKKLFKKSLPNCNVKLINKSTLRMSNLFRFKDQFPSSITSHFVYKYNCSVCNAAYVGMTTRHRRVRVSDHGGVSPRTGKVVVGTNPTAIREHRSVECSMFSDDDFTILSTGGNAYELGIKESIMIKKLKPELNRDLKSVPLYLF